MEKLKDRAQEQFKNITTKIYKKRTTIPLKIQKLIGLTNENEHEFIMVWNVDFYKNDIHISIIKKEELKEEVELDGG